MLTGNIFHSAVMKMSVVSPEFRERYLSNPEHPNRFEGRAVVFDGPEDYHPRIDDPALAIDENTMLFMRGAGPKGYPGAAEVVNMRAPDYLLKKGITSLVCVGDGRQSGTSGSPSILNASPEAASGGGAGADRDRRPGACSTSTPAGSTCWWTRPSSPAGASGWRRTAATSYPAHQTPWQEIQRGLVGELETGAVLEPAVKYQRIAQTKGIPRDNH